MGRSPIKYVTRKGMLMALTAVAALGLLFAVACGSPTEAASDNPNPTGGSTGQTSPPLANNTGNLPGSLPPDGSQEVRGSTGNTVGFPQVQYASNQQVGIWVSGVGEVSAVPDLAILTAGVEATAKTVQEARNQAAEAMDRMMQALTDQGVTAEEIQTRFFNISPEYIWNRTKKQQELVGYRVSNQISVKIRDLGSTGLIIDELAVAGGDLARIQGISFTVEDTKALEIEAREKAVAALLEKAQQYADLTGVQLGKPVYISESSGFTPVINNFADQGIRLAAAEGISTPISGGESTIRVMVQGVFAME